jgi:hypothetical protein
MKKAAIDCQLMDFRNDDRHKGYIKITLHLVEERGGDLHAMLGGRQPSYSHPVDVALAVLQLTERIDKSDAKPNVLENPPHTPAREKTRLTLSQQAGVLSTNKNFGTGFWQFAGVECYEQAAALVRSECKVASRKDILPGTEAEKRFNHLLNRFAAWKLGPRVGTI